MFGFSFLKKMTEEVADVRQKTVEAVETKTGVDANRRKQGRGRGHSVSGRGRGSRGNDQMRSQISSPMTLPSNEQLENSYHKVYCSWHINLPIHGLLFIAIAVTTVISHVYLVSSIIIIMATPPSIE